MTKGPFVISHYEQGNWIWDANTNQYGETNAQLPQEVYDAIGLGLDDDEDTMDVIAGNVRYRIERR